MGGAVPTNLNSISIRYGPYSPIISGFFVFIVSIVIHVVCFQKCFYLTRANVLSEAHAVRLSAGKIVATTAP